MRWGALFGLEPRPGRMPQGTNDPGRETPPGIIVMETRSV